MTGLTEGTAYNITIRSNNGTIGQDTGLPAELVNVNTLASKIKMTIKSILNNNNIFIINYLHVYCCIDYFMG